MLGVFQSVQQILLADGLIYHSDRGNQNYAHEYLDRLFISHNELLLRKRADGELLGKSQERTSTLLPLCNPG